MNVKAGLLDEILKSTGCLYISDLHANLMKGGVQKAVEGIKPGIYSDKEWQEAYAYISGEESWTGTEEEIRGKFKKRV